MKKYRKKPVVIEAMQINTLDDAKEALRIAPVKVTTFTDLIGPNWTLSIETLEGEMHLTLGDYLICGIEGEWYPCKPSIFEATYEEVETDVDDG